MDQTSIDFKGGTIVSVQYLEPVEISEVRNALSNIDLDGQIFDFSREKFKNTLEINHLFQYVFLILKIPI
ncbi:MAG: hypothetical protein Ct9H300mP18_11520 [Candidatus Neomarinimicrobiota bacterium]|nr:MAG: hypothetical protein Ct9H300mP18_11520 [Candidatus Neomarinimicrobiota bacterium]